MHPTVVDAPFHVPQRDTPFLIQGTYFTGRYTLYCLGVHVSLADTTFLVQQCVMYAVFWERRSPNPLSEPEDDY